MCILPLLDVECENPLNDDKYSGKQILRHVCVTLKKYMEVHLFIKVEKLMNSYTNDNKIHEYRNEGTQKLNENLYSYKVKFVSCIIL